MPINPYEPPLTEAKTLAESRSSSQTRVDAILAAGLAGAVVAGVSSIPLAGLIGLVFRFPMPVAGYVSGPDVAPYVMLSAILYLGTGGVFVQAAAGSVGGILSFIYAQRYGKHVAISVILGGVLGALPGLLILSVLDWIIGPW